MDEQRRVPPVERGSRIIENIHPPTYQASQSNFGAAPENIERIIIPDNDEEDKKRPDIQEPSPTFSHATPITVAGASPVYSDSTPLTIPTPSDTLISTRSFSFSNTLPTAYVDQNQAKESLGREQADLEVAAPGNFDKEVYFPDSTEKEVPTVEARSHYEDEESRREERETIHGLRKRTFWIIVLIVCLLIVGIALGVGLGLGLRKKDKSPGSNGEDILTGGALDAQYFSTQGAFNGSGIALASQSFQGDEQGTMVLYYQHYTGTIRYKQLRENDWVGGTLSEVVAFDAKNGTPISAVAYALNNVSTWHIFYIDVDNHIRQKTNSNVTNIWQDGEINQLNLTAMDAESVGMQACWYGSFYGDTDYADLKPTVTADGSNATTYSTEVGMHIWYASDATTFQQYGWRDGYDNWEKQDNWTDMNGHAGVGCYSWGPGTVTYTIMVNSENTAEIWWKDTNASLISTPEHPINVWTNSSAAIPNVYPHSSLGYTTFLYAQDADTLQLKGYNVSWHAEKTEIIEEDNLTVEVSIANGGRPVAGSHFSVSAINDQSGGESLIVFYQTLGNDITEFTRDLFGGMWSYIPLPMNDR